MRRIGELEYSMRADALGKQCLQSALEIHGVAGGHIAEAGVIAGFVGKIHAQLADHLAPEKLRMILFKAVGSTDHIVLFRKGVQDSVRKTQTGFECGEVTVCVQKSVNSPNDISTGFCKTVTGTIAANTFFFGSCHVVRCVDDLVGNGLVDSYGIVFICRSIAAQFLVDVVATTQEFSGIGAGT